MQEPAPSSESSLSRLSETLWKLTISSLVLCLFLHAKSSSVFPSVFRTMGLAIPLSWSEMWVPPALSRGASLSLLIVLLWFCGPPCPLCYRDSPSQACTGWLFQVPLPPWRLSFWILPELMVFPLALGGQPEAHVKRIYCCCGFILLLGLWVFTELLQLCRPRS